jgi:8-oxo-dGTP pyrophosphatase MutT (NUDIX family)
MNSGVDFAAGGIVLSENKILIVKNKKGDSSIGGEAWWGYPKGHLEEGEKPSEAAVREVYEETGFEVKIVNNKPVAESRYEIERSGEVLQKTVWLYEMKVVALVDFETALDLLTHDEDRKILKYVFNQ